MKFMNVFDDDRREYSVYNVKNESTAFDAIEEKRKKGWRVRGVSCDAVNKDEAALAAESIAPNYYCVLDVLADD